MSRRVLPPVLRDNDENRSATWLELFFDVVFVVSMAALAQNLQDNISLEGIFYFALTFLALWWVWMEYSFYADLFDTQGITHQSLMLAGMFGVGLTAIIIRSEGSDFINNFARGYIGLTSILFVMYAFAHYYIPEFRKATRVFLITIGTSILIWTISIYLPMGWKQLFWVIGIAIQASAGPYVYLHSDVNPEQNSHMPERFGLFMIIVLGEGIAAVINGLDEVSWNNQSIIVSLLSFLIIALIWKLYFYQAANDSVSKAIRGSALHLKRSFVYGYAHYIIYSSAMIVGVGILEAIKIYNQEPHDDIALLIHGAMAAYLLAITLSQWAAPRTLPSKLIIVRIAGGLLSLALLLTTDFLQPVYLLGIQFLILFAIVFYEYYINDFAYTAPADNEI